MQTILSLLLLSNPTLPLPTAPVTHIENVCHYEVGEASWYDQGVITANGERFDPEALTAAHRSLPFGTLVRVTNLRNGRSVIVRINDNGPFVRGRIIDLSRGAARVIGMLSAGVEEVRVERIPN